MPPNDKRRDAARRQLERELAQRQQASAARRRTALIASIVGTVVVIIVIVVVVAVSTGGSKHKSVGGDASASSAAGPAVTFDGVTVGGAAVLAAEPTVSVAYTGEPKQLEYKDLVVGTGAAATDTAGVQVQYVGAVYKTGKVFQTTWQSGPAGFTLGPGKVIDGFTQGIGGTAAIPAMKVGGRRLIIMPASLAYGASPPSGAGIPANASLIFIVDLTKLTS